MCMDTEHKISRVEIFEADDVAWVCEVFMGRSAHKGVENISLNSQYFGRSHVQ